MTNPILESVKQFYGDYKGEPIEVISIGVGINTDNSYCIYDLDTKKIIHNGLSKAEVDTYIQYIKHLTK